MTKTLKHLLLITFTLCFSNASWEKCNAVTFEAGGDKGSYQAGAIFALTRFLTKSTDYNVVTGISVGAINTFGMALTAPGNMTGQANLLAELWSHLSSSDVFIPWEPFGILQGLFFKNSLFNYVLDGHLEKIIENQGFTKILRNVQIGACNATDGKLILFKGNQNDSDLGGFIQKVKASSSIPAVFNPTIIDGTYFIDGGTIESLPANQAVDRCIEMGYDQKDINLDLLLVNNAIFNEKKLNTFSFIDVLNRVSSIRSYYYVIGEIVKVLFHYPDVNFRYLVMPDESLDGASIVPINFSQPHVQRLIAKGDVAAVAAVMEGQGTKFHQLFKDLGIQRGSRQQLLQNMRDLRQKRNVVYVNGKGERVA